MARLRDWLPLAGIFAAAGVATWALWPKPASAQATGRTAPLPRRPGAVSPAAPAPEPATPQAQPTAPLTQNIAVQPGALSVQASPGDTLILNLPTLGEWTAPLAVQGNATVGSAPSAGSNPAGLTYNGGGATLTASWCTSGLFLPTCSDQSTVIQVTDA